MQTTKALGLFLILSASCIALGLELQGLSSYTVPVFMWSDKQIFSNAQVYDTITSGDMEFALATLLHRSTNKVSTLSSSFNKNAETPEVVVLFVESELRTDQVPYISAAFSSTPGGSLSHIKNAVEKSGSSLVLPYAAVSDVTLLDEALLDIIEKINNANIFMSGEGSNIFSRLRQHSSVKNVELNSLLSELKSGNAFDNGVADLVIVTFDKSSTLAISEHDSLVADLLSAVSKASKGNYVAMYTANKPVATPLTWAFSEQATSEAQDTIMSLSLVGDNESTPAPTSAPSDFPTVSPTPIPFPPNTTHHKINYFPGAFIEILLICAVLITMLFTGACAIFSLQTPDKWEAPKVKREL